MKVVFIKNLKGVAKKDEVKNVADGYALNRLIPGGFAVPATKEAVSKIQEGKALSSAAEQKHDDDLRELLARLSKTKSIIIADHPHAKGRLYNAVTAQEISHAIQVKHTLFIPKELILDYEPKREVGDFEIKIGDKKQSISYLLKVS